MRPAAHSAPPPLHPHSSLFSPAAWMKGITTHLNNSTQHVPPSPTTSTQPPFPPHPPTHPPLAVKPGRGSPPPPSSLFYLFCYSLRGTRRRVIAGSAGFKQRWSPPPAPFHIYSAAEGEYLPAIRQQNVPCCTKPANVGRKWFVTLTQEYNES